MLSRDRAGLKDSRASAASGRPYVKAEEKVGEAIPSHLRLTPS